MIRSFAHRISLVLVLGLAVMWLVLNEIWSPAHMVLGLVLGTMIAWASSTLRPLHARLRRLDIAAGLVLLVLGDALRSNLHVARVVLGLTGKRRIHSDFLDVPLDLKDPHGQAALAVILTVIPGTVLLALSADGNWLRLHVLDLDDEARMIRTIKERYERRLMRIFE